MTLLKGLLISFCLTLLISCSLAQDSSAIFLEENQISGFINLTTKGDQLFYWMFRSRNDPDTDPLVFWLTGGPGCSSLLAVFYENGPYLLNDNLTLTKNDYSWNNMANMVYLDQPVGTGFSYASTYVTNEEEIAEDFYQFLLQFYELYPEFIGRSLYITGESFAGHYIPSISSYIVKQRNEQILLKGVAIGNGMVDPYIQFPQYARFAYSNGLIRTHIYKTLHLAFSGCDALMSFAVNDMATQQCQSALSVIFQNNTLPGFNMYDIRMACPGQSSCYNFSALDAFLTQPSVIQSLHVQGRNWTQCSLAVENALSGDLMTNVRDDVKYLIDHDVFVFIYSGDKDFICNWFGGEAWTNSVQWKDKSEFNQQQFQPWGPNGAFGAYKMVNNFVFVRVYNSGHMVPMNQPVAASYMFDNFLNNWTNINSATS